jgi:hypothetical protein
MHHSLVVMATNALLLLQAASTLRRDAPSPRCKTLAQACRVPRFGRGTSSLACSSPSGVSSPLASIVVGAQTSLGTRAPRAPTARRSERRGRLDGSIYIIFPSVHTLRSPSHRPRVLLLPHPLRLPDPPTALALPHGLPILLSASHLPSPALANRSHSWPPRCAPIPTPSGCIAAADASRSSSSTRLSTVKRATRPRGCPSLMRHSRGSRRIACARMPSLSQS